MKKNLLVFVTLVIITPVFSQVPDFNGSWKLNSEKSKLNAEFSFAPKEIIITQNGNDIQIEKHSSFQDQDFVTTDKLTLDGKECINPGFMDTQKKSTCTWQDDKTSLKIVSKITMNDGGELIINEVYKLIDSNLMIESSSTSSFGEMKEEMVYEKK